jgi:lysophospholipase L1-like esterase
MMMGCVITPSIQARLVLALLATLFATTAQAKPKPLPDHWVGTWATAPYALDVPQRLADLGFGAADMTIRETVHTSLAGPLVRVELTNEFGTEPLIIGGVHLALAGPTSTEDGGIALASGNAMTFNGSPTITIPAGGMAVSDPAALAVPAGGDLTVSIFLPAQTISRVSFHNSAYQTNYLATGNVVGARTLTTPRKVTSWYFLKAVDVRTPGTTGAIVAFGDSITDGTGSTLNMNMRWPDVLARRLHADKKTAELSVLNEGIGGNRVLHDTTGPNALARFDRDVLAMSGVKYLVILESINDIGHAADPVKPYDVVTADDLIQGLAQMVERAHTHGIKVIGATLTPYAGAKYASPAGEAMRQAVNTWIRTTKTLDGVVDFDKATLDPAHPDAYKADFESGDHLHPKDAGYKAMGDAFDLKLFYPTK